MKIPYRTLILVALGVFSFSGLCPAAPRPSTPSPTASRAVSVAQTDAPARDTQTEPDLDAFPPEEPIKTIADPFEPINRLFFHVNDKLYFWVLKPVASAYATVFPQPARVGVRNFFSNATTPIRVANCLLQFKFKGAGTETVRFVVNTSIGFVGLVDIAKKEWDLKRREEDFGQTLGFYGIGPVFYINWPVLGPSSVRDTTGTVGDFFLNPWNYLVEFPILVSAGVGAYERVNNTSLTIGEYEALKEAALDPYIAMRDAYHQFRQTKITE